MTDADRTLLSKIESLSEETPILFYDGVCGLCNGFISVMIKHDKKQVFRYASLQEKEGKIISEYLQLNDSLETVIALSRGVYYAESDVLLLVARELGGWWSILRVIALIPKRLRDWTYRLVARHRYKIAGKRETCTFVHSSLRLHI